jgi:hypothetical protein
MGEELDNKILNQQNGFNYPDADQFDATKHVRLLRIPLDSVNRRHLYTLEVVLLEHLRNI